MKTELSITLQLDAIFHQTCKELCLTPVCIREEMDANRYEVHYMFPHELFYLGIQMGIAHSTQVFTKQS